MQREKKTEIITLRVTPRTKDRIRAKAQELGLTVTDYLCLCGLGKKIVQVDGLDKVLSELKAQGRNLNQLTTLANMGKITVVYGDRLAENYGQVSEQLRQLAEVTGWPLSPQSKIVVAAEALSAVCCDTPNRRKKRCGRGGSW